MDGRVTLVAGDYSGKGLDAVGTAARLRHHLAAHAAAAADPGSFLQEVNATIADILPARRFASVVCCTLDHENGRLDVALAGHPAPLRLRAGVVEELVAPPNLPLGIDPRSRFEGVSFSLQKDDVLVLFTDGVTEARYEGMLFGVEGIGRIIKDEATASLTNIARAVVTAAAAHHDPSLPHDDRLVLLARVPGSLRADVRKTRW
jgi:serine phosphatase RsbU (regulator of sigma subunit)